MTTPTAAALTAWYRHEVTITPYEGVNGYGEDVYGEPFTVLAMIDDRRRTVRAADGSDAISETTVLTGLVQPDGTTTPDVPLESHATLPASHGGRTARVLAVSRHDGGGQPTPDHLELALT